MSKLNKLEIGTRNGDKFLFPEFILKRHLACFGSSGSGKTVASKVIIEELAINGIPVIAFDLQGDVSSLGQLADYEKVKVKGISKGKIDSFKNNVEVVIWTPLIDNGIPICLNPLRFNEIIDLNSIDKRRYIGSTAQNITNVLGFDIEKNDGQVVSAILEITFLYADKENIALPNFKSVSNLIADPPAKITDSLDEIASKSLISKLIKRINLLCLSSKTLLFENGTPASIDILLGKDQKNEKTRLSVIYLNSLQTSEEKEFFIASIVQSLYTWMMKNTESKNENGLECALFIDEIAPYIPPVKKTACKNSLEMLFRQGRKYGVSSIIATQSPGDIDYKAIGQFSNFLIGSLNTKQDIAKVKNRLEANSQKKANEIIRSIPALEPGEFFFISPDAYDEVIKIKVRWLLTDHIIIKENDISPLTCQELKNFYATEKMGKLEEESILSDENFTEDGKNNKRQENMPAKEKSSDKNFTEHEKNNKSVKKNPTQESLISYIQHQIFERDIEKMVQVYLNGFLKKKDVYDSSAFKYIPLIKTSVIFKKRTGWIRKTFDNKEENLYLDPKEYRIFFKDGRNFKFLSVVDDDPDSIFDLDDIGEFKSIERSKIDYNFSQLKKFDFSKAMIKKIIERKYKVEYVSSIIVLFPIWECNIEKYDETNTRTLILDGILGREIINYN